jgi:MFS family permease
MAGATGDFGRHKLHRYMTSPPNPSSKLPQTIWVLGLVSFFMDISSEMIHAILPLFLTVGLGASAAIVGVIEGVAEATASIVKVFSGYISDRIGRRKPLMLIGYGLGALSKPFFAIAQAPLTVFTARFADRIGKGIRGAPRDALIADVTDDAFRGRAYGLRQMLDTTGAFVGPLIAIALMAIFSNDMRAVFWFAVIPGSLAVICVLFGVKDRVVTDKEKSSKPPIKIADMKRLSRGFWSVVAVGVIFMLARFSEAFLVLKANQAGLPLALAPLVYIVMNVVYAAGAYPSGAWADRARPATILLWGIAALVTADIMLAFAPGVSGAFAGIVLWGVHMALTQGLLAKLVAHHAPPDLRGSAFGAFNLATGFAALGASVIAGLIWTFYGPAAVFLTGATFAVAAAAMLFLFGPWKGASSI